MADLDRQPFDRGGDDAEGREVHRMPVARDDLGRDRLDREAHGLGDVRLHPRIDLRKGADRAGNGAGRDFLARGDEPFTGAREFRVGIGELDAESGRLGVDAVRAADDRRHLVLLRTLLQRGEKLVGIGDQDIGRAHQLHVEAGVQNVR